MIKVKIEKKKNEKKREQMRKKESNKTSIGNFEAQTAQKSIPKKYEKNIITSNEFRFIKKKKYTLSG